MAESSYFGRNFLSDFFFDSSIFLIIDNFAIKIFNLPSAEEFFFIYYVGFIDFLIADDLPSADVSSSDFLMFSAGESLSFPKSYFIFCLNYSLLLS